MVQCLRRNGRPWVAQKGAAINLPQWGIRWWPKQGSIVLPSVWELYILYNRAKKKDRNSGREKHIPKGFENYANRLSCYKAISLFLWLPLLICSICCRHHGGLLRHVRGFQWNGVLKLLTDPVISSSLGENYVEKVAVLFLALCCHASLCVYVCEFVCVWMCVLCGCRDMPSSLKKWQSSFMQNQHSLFSILFGLASLLGVEQFGTMHQFKWLIWIECTIKTQL